MSKEEEVEREGVGHLFEERIGFVDMRVWDLEEEEVVVHWVMAFHKFQVKYLILRIDSSYLKILESGDSGMRSYYHYVYEVY